MKLSLLKNLWVALVLFGATQFVQAQTTVSGKVTEANGETLIGVSILEKGTSRGTTTDLDGNFSMDVSTTPAILVFSYTGFSSQEMEVTSSTSNIEIIMEEDVARLDEVVVTGLASSVKRSNLANAVASIKAKELTGVTSQSTVDGALYGKFTGADIRANSGAPGGGFSVRLRGVTSVNLNQQPTFIIDGVFLDNSSISLNTNVVTAAAGGGNTSSNQDDASNRIADIIPEDIESIEILKGASAAAIYGIGGAGGVVLIKTKNGGYNQDTKVTLSQTVGVSNPIQLLGDRGWDAALVTEVFGADEAAVFNANGTQDYERLLFDNNPIRSITALSASGGSDKTKFYVSGTYRLEDGLVPNTGYDKGSVRVNLGHKLTDRIEINVASSYIASDADRGLFNNSNANTTVGYALAFTRPWDNLLADRNGNFPANNRVGSNVIETVNTITNRERINRFFGSLRSTWTILQQDNQSLKLITEGGLDQYTHQARGLFPQSLSYFRDPSSLRGASIQGFSSSTRTNFSSLLVHNYYTPSNLNFRTQAGIQQLDASINSTSIVATGLNGSQENIDQSENRSVSQNRLESQIKGVYFQEEVNYDDKIIATIGVRGDKSSNNGDANKIFWNPKASLAVNIHNLTDINSNFFSSIKPRIAWGTSVRFAGFGDRFNALDATEVTGNAGLFTSALRGNPNVRPEEQTELEFGVDLGLLNNRFSFSATYYNKTIDDLLLRAQVPASTGFTNQVTNAGELQNQGLELQLQGEVLRSGNFSWATGINWWRNRSEVTRLDIPAFNIGGFAAFLGQGRIEEGSPATQLIGSIDPSQCNGDDCSNVDPEGDGFMRFGDMEADFNLSWTNSIKFGDFDLSFLFHWKQGGDGINLSTLLYDLGNVTWDFDDTTLDPEGELTNGNFRLAALGVHPGVYIEDASYFRLREAGLYYNIDREVAKFADLRIGISGRNLLNFFDYNSYDPEVSNFGNNVLINSVEVTPYPSSRTFNFHLNVTF